MAAINEQDLRRLLRHVRAWTIEVEDAAQAILSDCGEGVTPSEPDAPAPSLLGAIGHLLRRLS